MLDPTMVGLDNVPNLGALSVTLARPSHDWVW